MKVTIVDYNSGNISSVINSFKEVAQDKVNIEVTADLSKIKSSDKVILPGQGSFKSCVDALNKINGLTEVLHEFAINNKKPLLGICVGLQMFADIGYEETETKGLGWISGKVSKINNQKTKIITKGRHDPCVGIRAVPIAEAMMAIILVDQIMMHEAQIGTLAK